MIEKFVVSDKAKCYVTHVKIHKIEVSERACRPLCPYCFSVLRHHEIFKAYLSCRMCKRIFLQKRIKLIEVEFVNFKHDLDASKYQNQDVYAYTLSSGREIRIPLWIYRRYLWLRLLLNDLLFMSPTDDLLLVKSNSKGPQEVRK